MVNSPTDGLSDEERLLRQAIDDAFVTTGTTIVPVWITQVIDLKTAGVRTITSATTSPLGTDTLVAVPSSVWLSGGHLVVFGTASSGTLDQWPYIIMTGQTTHGIESPNMTVRPVSGVIDEFADTVMQATIN